MRIFDSNRWCAGILLVLAFALGACGGTRGGPISYETANFKAPDAPKVAAVGAGYLISPGDTLSVAVFQAEALSRDYPVDLTGNISMPLIGAVKAVGLTTKGLETDISRRLDEKYMRNPSVTVALKESTSRNVTVDGSVKAPGVYPVTGDVTLIQVVALARGTDEHANPRRVAVFRTVDGKKLAAAFDLTAIRRGQSPDPTIYAGDIVVVDGSNSKSIFTGLVQTLPLLALFRPY